MLKSVDTLKSMDPNDKIVTVPDVFERYEGRTDMHDVCLADFAAMFTECKDSKGEKKIFQRSLPRVIRYVRYSHKKDPSNFFREQCLLFFPWRDEQFDIENQNCQKLYEENIIIVRQNQSKYVTITDDEIDELFKNLGDDDDEHNDNDESVEYKGEHLQEQSEDVDILAQSGIAKPKSQNITNRFF